MNRLNSLSEPNHRQQGAQTEIARRANNSTMLSVTALCAAYTLPTCAGLRCGTISTISTRPAAASAAVRMSYFHRVFRIAMEDSDSPIEALAAQAVQAEAVSSGLAEAAEEVAQMEAATAAELGLTTEELEVFMDGDDGDGAEASAPAASSSPVAAMVDLMTSQEDASAALAEGFREFEEIEKAIASELGVTVEELEAAEDYDLDAPPPEGFEWGVTY